MTMNHQLLSHHGFWAKAAVLLFGSLMLTLLPKGGIELRAQTLPPPPTLLPAQVNFGDIPVGTTSSPRTVTLTNNDLQIPMIVNSISTTSGFSATSNCPASLGPQSSCSINVTFSPATIGIQTGMLSVVVDTCSDDCIETLSATLNGNGIVLINAVDDAATTLAGTPVTINVLANDTGTALTVAQVTNPSNGSVVISNNTITYTPNANFTGNDSFTYRITDSFGQTDTATVTVTVNLPELNAVDDAATTAAGTPVTINVLANDTGTALTVAQVTNPSNGGAVISGNSVIYTPNANFAGGDSFTYRITDSFGQTDTATVTVTVNPPGLNAVDDAATTAAGTPVTINVLANDAGTGLTVAQVTNPSNGGVVINSNNTITYTPNANFTGGDSFTYRITDSFGQTATATVRITVNPPGLNAVGDTASTSAGTPVTINVLGNDSGTALTVAVATFPSRGSATRNTNNTITYTPNANFAGNDSFTYRITDSFGQTATATVRITVNPPGLNAVDDTASTSAGTPVTINVLANDAGTGLTVAQVTNPSNGGAAISGNSVIYTPNANFAGADTFTYTIRDSFGQSDTAIVRVTVIAPALEALDDTATTPAGTPVTIPVLANDVGTGLTLVQAGNPGHGSATISVGNTITYTSASNFIGVDAFTYTITDGISIDSATVTVIVTRSKEDVQKLLENATDDPSAKTVGRAIGGLCFDGAASANFLRDCNALIDAASANDPSVGSALEQITPKSLTTAIDASQTSVQSQMLGIRSRLAALRSGVMGINLDQLNIQRGGWTLSGRDLRYLLASTGEETGVPSTDIDTDLGPFGVFASGAINLGNRDETQNQTGFDFKTLELTLGTDYRFSDQSILGVALSYAATDTDMDNQSGSLDTRSYGLTLYGVHYLSDRFYVEGMVNYGRNDYDQQRNVAYQLPDADIKQHFDSNYSGRQFFVELGAGYQFTHGSLTFGPEARLSYLDVQVDPFQEHTFDSNPGSAWAVAVGEQNLQSLVSSFGGRASYLLNQPWGTLEPQVELSWLHEFKNNNQWLTGRFVEGAAVPDNSFQIFTDPMDKNYFRFSLGFLARFKDGPSALIQYRTLFDYEHLETHSITTQLRWEF